MGIRNVIAAARRGPFAAALLAATCLAAPSQAAPGGASRRALSAPIAAVQQQAFVPTRLPGKESGLFPAAVTPLAAWLAGSKAHFPREAEASDSGFEVAWELMSGDSRALLATLEDWTRTPNAADRRRLRAAIAAAYSARGYDAFWSEAGRWREAASSAAERLREASEDTLDLSAYKIPATDRGEASLEDELALSEAVAAYALQASGARVDPARVSRLIGARPALASPGDAVARVASAGAKAGDVLHDFNPAHFGYQALRTKLAELRSQRGANDGAHVAAAVDEAPANDGPPVGAKAARRKAAAKPPASRLEAEVIANMERWRWLPRDMGENRVEVNIPDFELAVVRGGEVAHRARVIVGKEETPTPVFSNALQFIIVNPYWHVPPSIINKEWGGDVSRAAAKGWKVSYRRGQVSVAQPPGESNALGRIKFIFPNDFAVYLHDTPSRGLFGASHRAFSHGCMRVQEPFALAEAVLGPGSGWSEQRVKKLIGGSERYINLTKPLPIHIEYFTAYVDEYGQLQTRGDLYGYSARVRRELGLGG